MPALGYCGRVQLYDALRAALLPDTPLREFLLVDPPAVIEDQQLSDVVVQIRWRGNTSRYYLYWPRTEVGE
jgi:hypothetical protein